MDIFYTRIIFILYPIVFFIKEEKKIDPADAMHSRIKKAPISIEIGAFDL
jgi:hypothetical protein